MTNLSRKIIEKIQSEHIAPEARWKHLTRRTAIWIGATFAVVLGAFSLGLILFAALQLDDEIFSFGPGRLLSPPVFRAIPLILLIALAASVALAIVGFRNTRHGYRHRLVGIIGVLFFLVVIGAGAVHFAGLNRAADTSLRGAFPGYGRSIEDRERFWSQPKDGFLAGKIIGAHPSGFSIAAFDGNIWRVETTHETIVRPMVVIMPHEKVKIIGDIVGDDRFEAEDIRPWERPKDRAPFRHTGDQNRKNAQEPDQTHQERE